ncbi:carbon-nitrogen hydrolase family protein [Ruicaihuangia caeni]|uniref:Carbon-nitrogen hydrolase family protein n=1 Tax=Ruicaihuangia caeni TaxID=3042517 RepID=A0AAW6TC11_9MICO|nr:carbon-nitrogen hydrolase family protein [Klugiella sp. YN-L-19]MDI2099363.1 carbon-nitrogen hydrolase family protein [Klugiella sp. YN-L-19]
MIIALAQFSPAPDRHANLESIRRYALQAVSDGAEMVVFPEYSSFFTGELDQHMRDAAEPLDGPFCSGVAALAEELGVAIIAGMLRGSGHSDRSPTNTLIAVGADGELLCTYDKIHLYDSFNARESDVIAAGSSDQHPVFSFGAFTIGLQTCFDLRFPEASRRLVDCGADVLVVPAQWVPGPRKIEHWKTLLEARAIENTCFVLGADQSSPWGVGHSLALAPDGTVIAEADSEPTLIKARLSMERLERVRRTNPSVLLRRYREQPALASGDTGEASIPDHSRGRQDRITAAPPDPHGRSD